MNTMLRYIYPETPEQEMLLQRVDILERAVKKNLSDTEQELCDTKDEYEQLKTVNLELRNMINVQRKEIDTIQSRLQSQIGTILYIILVLILVPITLCALHICKESQNKVLMLESRLEQVTRSINATCTNSSLEVETKLKEYFFQLESLKYSLVSENKYFEDLSKTLQGIEWRHKWLDSSESREGPTFYLGLYKVRIFLKFQFSGEWEDYTANYYLKRLEGPYDDVIGPCRIKYRYYAYVDQENEDNSVEWRSEFNTALEIGSKFYIGSVAKSRIAKFLKNNKLLFRVYFDISSIKIN